MEKKYRVFDPETQKTFTLKVLLDCLVGDSGQVIEMKEMDDEQD